MSFKVGGRQVGGGAPCLVVAEVGLAHDGSLQAAHAYVDAVARAGADAVKFQYHIAEAESTPEEPWRVPPEWRQDASRYEYWRRTSFLPDQWWSLAEHAKQAGLLFLCSAFSVRAVEYLDRYVHAWKVSSGEITNEALLEAVRATGKPAIVSTGMATLAEINRAHSMLGESPVAVLQCTSEYPCRPERLGLNIMSELHKTYDVVGLSDHSGTIYAGLAAATLGADIVEVHVKLSEHDRGPDASSSITPEELRQLVEGMRFVEAAKKPVDKDVMALWLEGARRLFMDKHRRYRKALEIASSHKNTAPLWGCDWTTGHHCVRNSDTQTWGCESGARPPEPPEWAV